MTLVDATAAIVLLSLLLAAVAVPLLKPDATPPDHGTIGVVALCALAALYAASLLRCGGRAWISRLLPRPRHHRSEEHTSELQSLMRISYAVFCLKKKKNTKKVKTTHIKHGQYSNK